jgi:RNA polymerase sigma-54 factor
MKFSFGQNLQQKLSQTMSPRMYQSMEILSLANTELDEKIEQELIDNPVLEKQTEGPEVDPNKPKEKEKEGQQELLIEDNTNNADDFERLLEMNKDVPEFFDERPRMSANRVQESADRQHDMMANVATRGETLHDFLLGQLHERDIDEPILKICERIVSTLSAADGGYFRVSLADLLPADASEDKLELAEEALAYVQDLEPVGVAARDLQERLMMQLSSEIPNYQHVRTLILDHLEDLQFNRLPLIEKKTGLSIEEINSAWASIRRMDPLPCSSFIESHVATVKPDLWLEKDEQGQYLVKMDEGPQRNLFISNRYRQILANGQASTEEKDFIKRKINSAQWLIEAIEQRRNTLLNVAQHVVDFQSDFLDNGPEYLKPLKMEQIAEKVGVHLTTVSRAVGDKYMETHRGVLPLKMFFVHGTTTDDGEDIAWNKIRIELQKLIDAEDKAKPLSDSEIQNRLKNMGFNVARRTVAKYREKLDIPSSRQRRDWTKKK